MEKQNSMKQTPRQRTNFRKAIKLNPNMIKQKDNLPADYVPLEETLAAIKAQFEIDKFIKEALK